MTRKGKLYIIGGEIILPAVKDVIQNVMKKDSQVVVECMPLSANTVQRHNEEMDNDVGKTLTYVLQQGKLAIQLDKFYFLMFKYSHGLCEVS